MARHMASTNRLVGAWHVARVYVRICRERRENGAQGVSVAVEVGDGVLQKPASVASGRSCRPIHPDNPQFQVDRNTPSPSCPTSNFHRSRSTGLGIRTDSLLAMVAKGRSCMRSTRDIQHKRSYSHDPSSMVAPGVEVACSHVGATFHDNHTRTVVLGGVRVEVDASCCWCNPALPVDHTRHRHLCQCKQISVAIVIQSRGTHTQSLQTEWAIRIEVAGSHIHTSIRVTADKFTAAVVLVCARVVVARIRDGATQNSVTASIVNGCCGVVVGAHSSVQPAQEENSHVPLSNNASES